MNKIDAFMEFRMLFPKMIHSLVRNNDFEIAKKENLNRTQIFTILHLWAKKECKMSGICKTQNVTKSTMTSIIDCLESRGLVQRIRKEDDRRAIYICLTKKGRLLGDKIHEDVSDRFNKKMKMLTKEEQDLFWSSLENINNIIGKIDG